MRRPSPCTSTRLAALLGLWLIGYSREAMAQATVEFDHATRRGRLIVARNDQTTDTIAVPASGRLELRAPSTVVVRVVNTNTGLYRLHQRPQATPAAGLEPLRSFLGSMRPYLPEVALFLSGAPRGTALDSSETARTILPDVIANDASPGVRDAWEAGKQSERAVATIDAAVLGPAGLRQTFAQTAMVLQQMGSGGSVSEAAELLRDELALVGDGCSSATGRATQLPVTTVLVNGLAQLARSRFDLQQLMALHGDQLRSYPSFPGLMDSLVRISQAAERASSDDDRLITAAYRIQTLALAAAYACPTWVGDPVRIGGGSGQTITLTAEPRPEPELSRVAGRGNWSTTVVLSPRWTVRPSIGGSFIVTPGASFPRFGARTAATGGTTEVFRNGTQDSRYNWGLSLGFTWRGLTAGSIDRPTIALWLPELTVNPGGDAKAFGVGAGVSWRFLKLGAGVIWVRHSELDGLSLGDQIPNKDFLRTRDAYGTGNLYFSLSVFDWPPFTAK